MKFYKVLFIPLLFSLNPAQSANRAPSSIDLKEYQFDNPEWRSHIIRQGCRDYCPELIVDLAIVSSEVPSKTEDLEKFKNLSNSLNFHLRGQVGQQLVQFKIGEIVSFEELKGSSCALTDFGKEGKAWNQTNFENGLDHCKEEKILVPGHVTLFISKDPRGGIETRGYLASNIDLPAVMLDYRLLLEAGQIKASQGVAGAFGLTPICVPHATRNDATPLMASSGEMVMEIQGERVDFECPGYAGLRNQGLNSEQMLTMITSLKKFNRISKKALHYLHPGNRKTPLN